MADPQTYRRIFEDNADGALILEDLVKRFSQPQVSAGGIDAVLKTYERGGMRKVLDYILGQINRANGVQDNAQEDPPIVE